LATLAAGVEVLVATPGRLLDFVRQGVVTLDRCGFLVSGGWEGGERKESEL